jgi:hypothetical protein
MNAFAKPIETFVAQEWPLVVFNAGQSPNDIAIEHVNFYIHNCWFMHSKWKMSASWISIYSFFIHNQVSSFWNLVLHSQFQILFFKCSFFHLQFIICSFCIMIHFIFITYII